MLVLMMLARKLYHFRRHGKIDPTEICSRPAKYSFIIFDSWLSSRGASGGRHLTLQFYHFPGLKSSLYVWLQLWHKWYPKRDITPIAPKFLPNLKVSLKTSMNSWNSTQSLSWNCWKLSFFQRSGTCQEHSFGQPLISWKTLCHLVHSPWVHLILLGRALPCCFISTTRSKFFLCFAFHWIQPTTLSQV